jgi:hypothetical protein
MSPMAVSLLSPSKDICMGFDGTFPVEIFQGQREIRDKLAAWC